MASYDFLVLVTAFCNAEIASASNEFPTCSIVFVPDSPVFLNICIELALTTPSSETLAKTPVSLSFLENTLPTTLPSTEPNAIPIGPPAAPNSKPIDLPATEPRAPPIAALRWPASLDKIPFNASNPPASPKNPPTLPSLGKADVNLSPNDLKMPSCLFPSLSLEPKK